jgi:predicted aspartyl protease
MKQTLAAAALAVLALMPAQGGDDCKRIGIVVSLDMLPATGNRVVVPAAVDGKPLRMVVDTGGYLTALTEDKARELGLPISSHPDSGLVVYGGLPLRRFATLDNFSIGRLKAGRLEYPLLPPGFLGPDVDGLLSPDFLANFDLDFDFAGGKLNFVSKDHCDGKVGYWTNLPLIGIPIVREQDGLHISAHVKVDGQDVKAIIDTGAPHSLMSLEVAQDIYGFKDDDPKLESVANGPNKTSGAKRYPIKEIKFGDVVVNNPNIVLVPEREARMGPNAPKMILGLSVLRQLHLYIAYREKMIYATPASEHK